MGKNKQTLSREKTERKRALVLVRRIVVDLTLADSLRVLDSRFLTSHLACIIIVIAGEKVDQYPARDRETCISH